MKKTALLAGIGLGLALVLSCAIEDFSSVPTLNTPLGLVAFSHTNISGSQSNRVVRLQFWGMNNEIYFSGYEVFLAESLNDLTNATGSYRVLPNANGESNAFSNDLSVMANPVTEATLFTYDVYRDTNLSLLNDGQTYYFEVRAYSYTWGNYSLPSNRTNAVYFDL